jgi:hypothetical protein
VTRGTRPKKPSSSRGFTREARGSWGSWGLKIENQNIFSPLFQPATTTKKNNFYFLFFIFSTRRGPDRGRTGARRVLDGVPDGCQTGYLTGGQTRGLTGCPTGARRGLTGARRGPDGVPNGSHVIGHIIFDCHVTRLGWQGVILLPTLLSQR